MHVVCFASYYKVTPNDPTQPVCRAPSPLHQGIIEVFRLPTRR